MPNLTTHINFIKYLTNKKYNNYDLNYLVLGSIAPDYYFIFNKEKKGCLSHFEETINDESNLDIFNSKILKLNVNHFEKSYIVGYYSHLWLDNYFYNNCDKFTIINNNFSTTLLRKFLKENIKIYDLKSTRELINSISISPNNSDFNDILPISLNKSIHLLNDLKFKSLISPLELSCPTVIENSSYNKFLLEAANSFYLP